MAGAVLEWGPDATAQNLAQFEMKLQVRGTTAALSPVCCENQVQHMPLLANLFRTPARCGACYEHNCVIRPQQGSHLFMLFSW
jgi:hypothetical protein